MIFLLKLVLEREEILDDTVMNHYDLARTIAMRVRVLFGRPPVGRPSRMPYAVGAVERFQSNRLFKVTKLSFCPAYRERAFLINHGYARRIIATVFELPQTIEDYSDYLLITYVTDYSAHWLLPLKNFLKSS
jgi:hypothetical protein